MVTLKSIFEVTLAMLPESPNRLVYKNFFLLNDNFSEQDNIYRHEFNNEPVKFRFALLLFCKQGDIDIRINLQDFKIRSNNVLIIPPGSIMDAIQFKGNNHIGFIAVGEYKYEFTPNNTIHLNIKSIIRNEPVLVNLRPEAMDNLISCYHHLRHAISDDALEYKDQVIDGYLQVMTAYWLNDLEKESLQQPHPVSRAQQIFNEFIQAVRQHYTRHRDITFYAQHLCITPKYLGVVVSRASGRKPSEWIRDYVILDAKAMIKSGNYTIQQVCDALHFPNPSFFGKYFKAYVGCTPGQYQKQR